MATWLYTLSITIRLKDSAGIYLDNVYGNQPVKNGRIAPIKGGPVKPTGHQLFQLIPAAEVATAQAIAETLRTSGLINNVQIFMASRLRPSVWSSEIHQKTEEALTTISQKGEPDSGNISIEAEGNVVVVRLGNVEFLDDKTRYSEGFPEEHGFWYFYEVGMAPNPNWRFVPGDDEGREGIGVMIPTGGKTPGHPGIAPRYMHNLTWKFIEEQLDDNILISMAKETLTKLGYKI